MSGENLRCVDDYMRRPYAMNVYWDEDYWAVEFPELPYLAAAADTWDELPASIDNAKRTYFASMLERGDPIPEPGERVDDVSGKLQLRLPKSLHRQIARLAERDGVSINTVLVTAAAKEVGRAEVKPARARNPKKTAAA